MANVAVTSDAWTEISITSGTIQNVSATAEIELSAEQTDNSGVVLKPSEIYQWDNETIYARAVTEAAGALRVVNFKRAAGGGGGYVLPAATASTLGGVKVGSNLSINESGVLSAAGPDGFDPVGRVVFDVILRDGYIKANGATVSDASTAVPNLLQFVQDNSATLLAADAAAYAANVGLYLYDSDTDALTLPNYTGRGMQGGASVESVEAGLPNMQGELYGIISTARSVSDTSAWGSGACDWNIDYTSHLYMETNSSSQKAKAAFTVNAADSNSIYGNSATVQPPAIIMIPQIKY